MDVSTQELMEARDNCKTVQEYRKYTMILLHKKLGVSIQKASEFFHYNVSSFYRIKNELSDRLHKVSSKGAWGGRRKSYLSYDEELQLITELEKEGEHGDFVDIRIIKAKLEERIGHTIHKTSIYRFLERHNWRKISPRKYHPSKNAEAQEAFKKTSQK
jgi:transposase